MEVCITKRRLMRDLAYLNVIFTGSPLPDMFEKLPPQIQERLQRIADQVDRVSGEAVVVLEMWEAHIEGEAEACVN
jgi:hypothetical protein